MLPYPLNRMLETSSWLLILFGSLITLDGSLGQDLPCYETLLDFCCNGKQDFNTDISRISNKLGAPCNYCVIKGHSWGKGCNNVKNITDEKIVGRRMFFKKKKGGAGALARQFIHFGVDNNEADNHQRCTFGTEPWCNRLLESCGDRPQEEIQEPPEVDDPNVIEGFCRKFDNDWIRCRAQDNCIFSCANRRCQTKALYKLDNCCWCSQHCFNPCACKQAGCEYSVGTGACLGDRPKKEAATPSKNNTKCPILNIDGRILDCDIRKFNNTCLRPNSFYSVGGVICRSTTRNYKCEIAETIQAVNLNGCNVTDQHGISYRAEEEVTYDDPFKVRIAGKAEEVFTSNREKDIYKTYVYGGGNSDKDGDSRGKCLTYGFAITLSGSYQLGLKVVDFWHDMRKQRRYNILLNEVLITPELDVLKYTKRKNYAADIYVNFQVKSSGKEGDSTVLHIQGFPPVKLVNDHMTLSLCPGTCDSVADSTFQLSAFSVVKMKSDDGTKKCEMISEICDCRKQDGCKWNSDLQMCIEEMEACSIRYIGEETDCIRAGSYMVSGGTWCRNPSNQGNCTNPETAFGINFNGLDYTDSNGIKYVGESAIQDLIHDEGNDRVGGTTGEYCNSIAGVTEDDSRFLYSTVVHGNKNRDRRGLGSGGECLGYPLPVCKDGRYKISINTVESYWNVPVIRWFNVRLGGLESEILTEVDLAKLNERCHATELVFVLDVDANQRLLKVQGHQPITLEKDQLELKFCYSGCDFIPDPLFQVSAFSLVRLGDVLEPTVSDDICSEFSGDLCRCKNKAGNSSDTQICEYNAKTGDCVSFKEECTLCDIGPGECRRQDAFYSHEGVLCLNQLAGKNCQEGELIIELNLGNVIDLGGRSWLKPQKLDEDSDCVQYSVPLTTDGWYELTITLGDFAEYNERKRTFTFIFNGAYIVQEMDVLKYRKKASEKMRIIVNFKVTKGNTIQFNGYPEMPIVDGIAPLRFCLGDCVADEDNDFFYQLNSFRVVKILQMGDEGFEIEPVDNNDL